MAAVVPHSARQFARALGPFGHLVDQHHLGAGGQHGLGAGQSDAGGGTGDDKDFGYGFGHGTFEGQRVDAD